MRNMTDILVDSMIRSGNFRDALALGICKTDAERDRLKQQNDRLRAQELKEIRRLVK